MHSNQNSLIEGPIWKSIILFALPVLLGNIFQQLYNTFDAWVVGNYLDDNALAAVTSSGSLIFMMISFFSGLSMGAGVIIARAYGAKDYESMRLAIHTNIAFGLVAGVILSVAGVVLCPVILGWMGTPEEVFPESVKYFQFYFCGAIFTVMYNVCVGILHAVGDSKHPLYYLIISSIINVILDMLFVAVLGFGVGSAALATTVSQGISALLCFIRLVRFDTPYKVHIRQIRFHGPSFMKIVRHGLPAGIQNSVIALANLVVQSNINEIGKEAMAGCGAYSKLEGFAFLPVTCFSQALATFVGQNLGARKYDRVKKGTRFGIICCVILAEVVGLTFWRFAPQLVGFFNDSQKVIDYGSMHMKTIAPFFFLLAFSHCIAAIMRGAGKTSVPMFTMLICWCLIRVTYITIAMQYVKELTTISWAYPLTWSCSSLFFLIYYLKADWIHSFDRIESRQ